MVDEEGEMCVDERKPDLRQARHNRNAVRPDNYRQTSMLRLGVHLLQVFEVRVVSQQIAVDFCSNYNIC